MDSVTQFVLGAAVSAVFLGPKIGPRKAVILGGLLGTVPDLDTFLPATDPVEAFVSHRGATHSLLMQVIVTPLFAEPLVRLFSALRDPRIKTYLAVYLIFATHALVDAMTVYGTQLLWPFGVEPVGVGSIFIIDPIYTLPLLALTVWALFKGQWTPRFGTWLRRALVVSSAYMLMTIPVQQIMKDRGAKIFADRGIMPERILAIPTPFNIAYWKVLAIDGGRYITLYLPVFGNDEETTAYVYSRRMDLIGCLADDLVYQKLAAFSDGFYTLSEADGRVVMSDLRMGLTPSYVFRFEIADVTSDGAKPLTLSVRLPTIRGLVGDLEWLQAGLLQSPTTRPAEAAAQIALGDLRPSETRLASASCTVG